MARWLESTGFDFTDWAGVERSGDVLTEFYDEWAACVRDALSGTGPWPDLTPERFAGLLEALADVARRGAGEPQPS